MNGPETVPIKVVKREIAFSAAARHNNIVQLLDVFAEKNAQLVIVVSDAGQQALTKSASIPQSPAGGMRGRWAAQAIREEWTDVEDTRPTWSML